MGDLSRDAAALHADREPAAIADHAADCCAVARAWLECLDSTLHRGAARAAPPAWIAQRWTWGRIDGPRHWCEVPEARQLDCRTSAALARELWSRRCDGIRAVQIVERLSQHRLAGCRRDELLQDPAGGCLAYHEAIGLQRHLCLQIWDAADCAWRRPPPPDGWLVLRVRGAAQDVPRWGEHRLTPGAWNALG